MPSVAPIKRADLIRALRKAGFTGPRAGGNHEYMQRDGRKVYIPNPHGGDINREFLLRILKQAGLSREEWEGL